MKRLLEIASKTISMVSKQSIMRLMTILFCTLTLLPALGFAANITVKVDRNPVMQDETFHITYEADTNVDASPDFSAIYNNFDILNSSQSTNMRLINGNYSMKKTWDLTAIGNKTGTFTIPSIPFGKDLSPALRIKVAKNAADAKGKIDTAEIFVEVETDTKSPYIESEIIYTARLVRSIDITQGQFSALETSDPDAIIINLGNVPQYSTIRKGKRYVVNEIRYAVYPQHSGKLTFKPLLFQARISQNNSRSLFDQFLQAGRIKRIRSKKLSISVKAKPTNIKDDDWLPVKNLSINEEWSGDLSDVNVGEPITRTITLKAKGFTAEQLPDLTVNDLDNVKQYPDQSAIENTNAANGITATKKMKVAIIPTKAGLYTLPEIAIPWWNTKTKRLEIAKIPETTITATGSANTIPITPLPTETNPKPAVAVADNTKTTEGYWPWISLALGIGWLFTILYVAFNNKTVSTNSDKTSKPDLKPKALKPFEKAIKNACNTNDAKEAKDALIHWARIFWQSKNINSLADIAKRADPEFHDALIELNSVLYASDKTQWNGDALLHAFSHFKIIKRYIEDTHTTMLEPLYK